MIIDASAAIDLLVRSPRTPGVLTQVERAPFLGAPQLIAVEVASALWRLVRAETLTCRDAERALDRFATLRIDLLDHGVLLRSAWALRRANRIADCFYLAAAQALEAPLLTTDRRLARADHGVSVVTLS